MIPELEVLRHVWKQYSSARHQYYFSDPVTQLGVTDTNDLFVLKTINYSVPFLLTAVLLYP